jgi:tetratricopeptide (TPR) repeat protein
MKKKLIALAIFCSATSAIAADMTPAGPAAPSWKSQTRQFIDAKNFDQAINVLLQADEKQSADWNNLMGYSLRKKTPPNLAEAEKYYQLALVKEPKHRGALEYYGELLLLKNDLAGAETMLSRLDKACTFSCEEYRDLKKSISQFKSRK